MVLGVRLGLPKQEVYALNTLGEIEEMLSASEPSSGGKGPLPAVEVCVPAITFMPSLADMHLRDSRCSALAANQCWMQLHSFWTQYPLPLRFSFPTGLLKAFSEKAQFYKAATQLTRTVIKLDSLSFPELLEVGAL